MPGRLLVGLVMLALVLAGFPRIEAHAHAGGVQPHAPVIHFGASHDHEHAGEAGPLQQVDPQDDATHDGGTDPGKFHDVIQHLHLLPHVVALLPGTLHLPLPRQAPQVPAGDFFLTPLLRSEDLFRPPIR